MTPHKQIIYRAAWVLPVDAAAVPNGAVAVRQDRIVAVGPADVVQLQFPEFALRDFAQAIICPGLVNCHTHLELTAMRGFLEPVEPDFFAWLRRLTKARMERMSAADVYFSARLGALEAVRAGITCVGDAAENACASIKALKDVGLRGIVYQESFGPDEAVADESTARMRSRLDDARRVETHLVRAGVSPHSPYLVSNKLLKQIARLAVAEGLPIMLHAAESAAESQLLLDGSGPFAESFVARGINWPAPGVSSVRYLADAGVLDARPLLAHCIRVDEQDIDLIVQAGAGIAHCPKSNAKLGHGIAPLAMFRAKGARVGLGSDSVASNNTCDLLEEARFALLLARAVVGSVAGSVDAQEILACATIGGACALGLDQIIGTLTVGKQADLMVLSLAPLQQHPCFDPYAAAIHSSAAKDVVLTVVAGAELYDAEAGTSELESESITKVDLIAARLAAAV